MSILRASPATFGPPASTATEATAALATTGYVVLDGPALSMLTQAPLPALAGWTPTWSDLPADAYLKDGGRYRQRRHSCFLVEGDRLERVAHRAHWQPVEYNALHGGMQRWFEPVSPAVVEDEAWTRLIVGLGRVFDAVRPAGSWFVEAHQFRIDTANGIGRPTPEGAHRDGVDFVVVILVARHGVKGGETRVFDANGPHGLRFTMLEPWTTLLLDDARVIHETTPVQPLGDDDAGLGTRDTLVLTYRRDGFQGDGA